MAMRCVAFAEIKVKFLDLSIKCTRDPVDAPDHVLRIKDERPG
jgi:hypothetical protein